MYVLKRNLSLPGHSPYEICRYEGDYPHSTLDVEVTLADGRCAGSSPPSRAHSHGRPPCRPLCLLACARANAEPTPPPPRAASARCR